MFERRTAIFLINLVQDVGVLRPLMSIASRNFGFDVLILASARFRSRDLFRIWEAELELIRADINGRLVYFSTDYEAYQQLQGTGIIFSASESSLPEHAATHAVFRYAPPTFLKVTLQHGFECVGFRHNAAHDRAHGQAISFGADVLCAWQPTSLQPSMALSQVPKVCVTGPPAVLQAFTDPLVTGPAAPGLICENLHSTRMNTKANLKSDFVETFREFCESVSGTGRNIVLRPHPGGQFVLKQELQFPTNVIINNAPIFRLDIRQFAYGISAPSSVLIDMLLAGIPTAVWSDANGGIDTSNYAGLTQVSTSQDWLEFAHEAAARPERFMEQQRRFLAEQQMPLEPRDVFQRYAKLFQAASRLRVSKGSTQVAQQRLLIVANAHLPTVQVCLERPLRSLLTSGKLISQLLTESRLKQEERRLGSSDAVNSWIEDELHLYAPDVVIFSRYSGPYSSVIVEWARQHGVPVIYHIDDDLLGVPRSLGESKYFYHNAPERLSTVRELIAAADMVYASTNQLRQHLLASFPEAAVVSGAINCSGRVMRTPDEGAVRVIGYMASADHLPNLLMVLPAIVGLLEKHQDLSFEMFGSIPVPESLERFGNRVRKVPQTPDYERFLSALADRNWQIGICPLVPTDFNRNKSNNKWVEYTSAGIAVVASSGMVYDECCADGCGMLADGLDEWESALERLVTNADERLALVRRAQRKLETTYGIPQHQRQILDILRSARERALSRAAAAPDIEEDEVV